MAKTMNIPRYSARVDQFNGQDVLRIWDTSDSYDPAISVTNAAERVLAELTHELGQLPEIVIYKDTDGLWDRMIPGADGRVTFAPIVAGKKGGYDDREAAELATGGKQ